MEYFFKLAKNINVSVPKNLEDYSPILNQMKKMALEIKSYQQELFEKELHQNIPNLTLLCRLENQICR